MRAILRLILVATVLVGIVSCSSTPGNVIPKDKMAHLLADLHLAESVVELDRTSFHTDSMKKVLKQSVFMRYGVTQEQVDTSFDWYGHHIKDYIEVYDKTISLLEDRVASIDAVAEDMGVTVAGDSVDIWHGSRTRILSKGRISQYLDFVLTPDDNWQSGDAYEWRIKLLNNRSPLEWGLLTDYSDGTTEYVASSDLQEGWNSLTLHLDSTRTATRVYGYATVNLSPNERVFLDSISLMRTRVPRPYGYIDRSKQHSFGYGRTEQKHVSADNDEDDTDFGDHSDE
jgi:hypothetical protein